MYISEVTAEDRRKEKQNIFLLTPSCLIFFLPITALELLSQSDGPCSMAQSLL